MLFWMDLGLSSWLCGVVSCVYGLVMFVMLKWVSVVFDGLFVVSFG